jgi:hypothetical protein
MVNIHCAIPKFTHSLASRRVWLLPALRPASCPDNSHHVPSGPSLRKHYASFFALTTTCASPKASPPTSPCRLAGESLQLGPPAAALQDLPDVSSRESFPRCLDLYSGGLWSAFARFFLQSIGLPQNGSRSALSSVRTTTSVRDRFSKLQSFLYVQASRFACHPGRSHRCYLHAWRP